MKVKIAMYKMKVNDIKNAVTAEELLSWIPYPGDFSSAYSPEKRKITKKYAYGYKGKRTIYLSSN
jgi:hypothetical protein